MSRGFRYFLARLLVVLLAIAVYLALLPIQISLNNGLSIRFPAFIRFAGNTLAYPEPINWNYILLLPVSLLILVIGYEIVRLLFRRP